MPLGRHVELPSLDASDLVFVPGWRSPKHLAGTGPLSERALAWVRAHHETGGTVASVCAGADALGRAGLLDGRRCTTHHELQEELARRYPHAHVVRDVLFVEDNRVVTSAGIASGIDLALHLVAVRHGPTVAAAIARTMVIYARRNGDDQQASVLLRHRSHINETVHRVQDVIESRLADRLSLAELADHAECSERTVTRLFGRATGMTPLRYQQASARRTRRAPDRSGRHRRHRRAQRRFRGRPDAAAAAFPLSHTRAAVHSRQNTLAHHRKRPKLAA